MENILSTIDCDTKDIKKFQIMFMSMGEPFLNYINLEQAIESLHDLYPNAQLLISTSAPSTLYYAMSEFIELSKRIPQVGLQFSVHESTDEARAKLIPTKTCTLRQIALAGEYEKINTYIYYYITDFADLLRKGEIIEIDIAIVLPFAKQSESKEYIKTRKHK